MKKRIAVWGWLLLSLVFGATETAQAQALPAPSDLIAQASRPGDLAISLFWQDNSTGEIGFEIQRAIGDSEVFETIAVGTLDNVGSFNDVGLEENTTYTYRVRAYDAFGASEYSGLASATTSYAMPDQVADLAAEVLDGNVSLTWTDMSFNETLFEVERAEEGVSTAYEIIAVLPPDTTSYVDTTARDGASYSYRIRPWRFDVAGGAPLSVSAQTGPALASLTGVTAKTKSSSSIELSWRAPSGGNAQVQIQRFNLDTGLWATIQIVRGSDKKFLDTRLSGGTAYAYRLRIVTATAVSGWSEITAVTR